MDSIEKKNKILGKSIKIMVLVILSTLFVVSMLLFIFSNNIYNKDNKNNVLVYKNNDNELKYVSSKNNTPIMLSKSFDEKINVKFNNDKTKLAYIKNRGLYLHNINSKDESEKIGVDVNYFKFINTKELLYIDVDNNLFIVSSSDNKNKIDIDVSKIIYNKNDIIIYNKGEEVYLYNITSKEKNSIINDYDSNKKIYFSKNIEEILYVSQNKEIKIYDIKEKESKVKAIDVSDIVDYSDDFNNIIYTKLGDSKKYYELFINDNPNDNPIVKYQCTKYEMGPYSFYYDFQKSDPSNNIYYIYEDMDGDVYYDENGMWHYATIELENFCKGADPSAELKEQIRNDETSVQLYDLYSIKDDKINEISKNIYETIVTKDNTIVYTKLNISDNNKVKISSLNSIEDLKNTINQVKPTLYYSNNEKKDELLVDSFDTKYKNDIDVINNKIYIYETNDKNELILYEYNTINNEKEKLSSKGFIIDTDVMGYDILFLDNFNINTYNGDLIGRINGKNTTIDVDVYSVIDNDKKSIYYYKDYDFKKLNGSYVINNIKKGKKSSINDISVVLRDSNDSFYIFKDYSNTSKTHSLFIDKGGKQKPIEYNIISYVYSY